jgi:phage gp36-like protein
LYCAQEDLLERISEALLIELSDDGETGQVDASVVARAIADADAEIDGYVGTRHQVPLSPVPALIRKVSVELAIYHLYSRRMGAPEEWRQRYQDNVRLLRDVAAGKVSLGADDPSSTPVAKPVLYGGQARVFDRDTLEDL